MDFELGPTGRIKGLARLLSDLTANDIKNAITMYEAANGKVDSYGDSTGYDLVHGNNHYPPKAILGLAASHYLKTQVKSSHFAGGESSTCFKLLTELGFEIAPKRPNQTDGLQLYEEYTREGVCKVFAPTTKFTRGSGSWGISGIVTPLVESDKVFFVTLEQVDEYIYHDALTEDGILVWKSQNQQKPTDKQIQSLVNHDHTNSNIYLFLRASEGQKYTYMGLLKFRNWDPSSSNPVHFTWEVLNWPVPKSILHSKNLILERSLDPTYSVSELTIPKLIEKSVKPKKRKETTKSLSRIISPPDWNEINRQNEQLGRSGELAVLDFEKSKLIEAGKANLAEKIEHTATLNGAAGYDIKSFDPSTGQPQRIEVKTTKHGPDKPFFISRNEISQSKIDSDSYWIYRLYNFKPNLQTVEFYRQQGKVSEHFSLQSELFSATLIDK